MLTVQQLQRIYFGAIAERYGCSFSEAQRVAISAKQLARVGFTAKQIIFMLNIIPRH